MVRRRKIKQSRREMVLGLFFDKKRIDVKLSYIMGLGKTTGGKHLSLVI